MLSKRRTSSLARTALSLALLLPACGTESSVVDSLANRGSSNRPQAAITAPAGVKKGDRVTLDAEGSKDPNGSPLTYLWTLPLAPSGSGATLSSTTGAVTSFTADKGGEYRVSLVATNGAAQPSDTATAVIDVTGTGANHPPVAVISATPGRGIVVLDGTRSHDADGEPITYRWAFRDLAHAVLTDADRPVAYLRAVTGTTLLVTLTVSDGIDDDLAYLAVTP